MKPEFLWQIFEKYPNIKFNENPSIESQVFFSTRTDRRTDMTELIVAFCNFTSASKTRFFGCRTQIRENIALVTESSTWQTESHVTGKHGNESVTQLIIQSLRGSKVFI
jgi:hypothetical protein